MGVISESLNSVEWYSRSKHLHSIFTDIMVKCFTKRYQTPAQVILEYCELRFPQDFEKHVAECSVFSLPSQGEPKKASSLPEEGTNVEIRHEIVESEDYLYELGLPLLCKYLGDKLLEARPEEPLPFVTQIIQSLADMEDDHDDKDANTDGTPPELKSSLAELDFLQADVTLEEEKHTFTLMPDIVKGSEASSVIIPNMKALESKVDPLVLEPTQESTDPLLGELQDLVEDKGAMLAELTDVSVESAAISEEEDLTKARTVHNQTSKIAHTVRQEVTHQAIVYHVEDVSDTAHEVRRGSITHSKLEEVVEGTVQGDDGVVQGFVEATKKGNMYRPASNSFHEEVDYGFGYDPTGSVTSTTTMPNSREQAAQPGVPATLNRPVTSQEPVARDRVAYSGVGSQRAAVRAAYAVLPKTLPSEETKAEKEVSVPQEEARNVAQDVLSDRAKAEREAFVPREDARNVAKDVTSAGTKTEHNTFIPREDARNVAQDVTSGGTKEQEAFVPQEDARNVAQDVTSGGTQAESTAFVPQEDARNVAKDVTSAGTKTEHHTFIPREDARNVAQDVTSGGTKEQEAFVPQEDARNVAQDVTSGGTQAESTAFVPQEDARNVAKDVTSGGTQAESAAFVLQEDARNVAQDVTSGGTQAESAAFVPQEDARNIPQGVTKKARVQSALSGSSSLMEQAAEESQLPETRTSQVQKRLSEKIAVSDLLAQPQSPDKAQKTRILSRSSAISIAEKPQNSSKAPVRSNRVGRTHASLEMDTMNQFLEQQEIMKMRKKSKSIFKTMGRALSKSMLLGRKGTQRPVPRTAEENSIVAQTLKNHDTFRELDEDQLEALVQATFVWQRQCSDVLFCKGDESEGMYFLIKGTCSFAVDSKELATLGPGESFGELAVIYDMQHYTTATFTSDAEIYMIPVGVYQELKLGDVNIRRRILRDINKMSWIACLERPERALAANSMVPRTVPPNQMLLVQGENPKWLFILVKGVAEVVVSTPDEPPTAVKTLLNGDYFGEQAILHRGLHLYSVRASTVCQMLLLEKEKFIRVLHPCIHYMVAHMQNWGGEGGDELRMKQINISPLSGGKSDRDVALGF